MRYSILLIALATLPCWAAIAASDGGSSSPAKPSTAAAPAASAPTTSKPAATGQYYQRGYRRGWFSGRSAKNWYLNRGTPDDNSTIPTPVNRHPKGRPLNDPVFFPKNM
ncbi:MAG TPA: hypothetical protein VHY91_16025 [Pirellulales bacterium]|jgi:hypothetical protein|nr:hypothetical protein [Pirellulales bacterium]